MGRALDQKVLSHILRCRFASRNAEYLRENGTLLRAYRPPPTHGLTSDSPRDAYYVVYPATGTGWEPRQPEGHTLLVSHGFTIDGEKGSAGTRSLLRQRLRCALMRAVTVVPTHVVLYRCICLDEGHSRIVNAVGVILNDVDIFQRQRRVAIAPNEYSRPTRRGIARNQRI